MGWLARLWLEWGMYLNRRDAGTIVRQVPHMFAHEDEASPDLRVHSMCGAEAVVWGYHQKPHSCVGDFLFYSLKSGLVLEGIWTSVESTKEPSGWFIGTVAWLSAR